MVYSQWWNFAGGQALSKYISTRELSMGPGTLSRLLTMPLSRNVHPPTPPGLLTWATHAIWMPSFSHCWGWTLLQRTSWTTDLWRVYTVNHCAGIPAFSTVCGARIEDREGWWLFSCHRVALAAQTKCPEFDFHVTAGLFSFLYFCLKTSKVLYFQREPRSSLSALFEKSYPSHYVSWNVPLQYALCNLHTLLQDDVSVVEVEASKGQLRVSESPVEED